MQIPVGFILMARNATKLMQLSDLQALFPQDWQVGNITAVRHSWVM